MVELVDERRKGNCVERVLRATARSYVISPQTLGRLAADPQQIRDRFSSAYLLALVARSLQDVSVLPFGDESVYDVLWAHTVVIERSAVEKLDAEPAKTVDTDGEEADDA